MQRSSNYSKSNFCVCIKSVHYFQNGLWKKIKKGQLCVLFKHILFAGRPDSGVTSVPSQQHWTSRLEIFFTDVPEMHTTHKKDLADGSDDLIWFKTTMQVRSTAMPNYRVLYNILVILFAMKWFPCGHIQPSGSCGGLNVVCWIGCLGEAQSIEKTFRVWTK